jgi:SAM-dependent methyltransferase
MPTLYDDARHYDALFPGPNLPFYQRQIAAYGGPVLELACGTGRLTVPLAAAAVDITGIDRSAAMLEGARQRADQKRVDVSFREADMRNFALGREFKLIFVPANSFLHLLEREEIESCLRSIRNHLAPEGRFVVDIFTPSVRMLAREENEVYSIGKYDDPDGKGRIVVTATSHYDAATQVNHSIWRYTNQDTQDQWEMPFHMRMFYPQEIDAFLRYNGFDIEHKFGGYDESPYRNGSPKQLIVSRRGSTPARFCG